MNSIIVTWQISFDYIRQTEPSAAGYLFGLNRISNIYHVRTLRYTSQRGDIAGIKEIASKSRIERLALLGKEYKEFLNSIDILATAYSLKETRKTKLSHNHPNTLKSMANLAVAYRNQGRWGKAKQIQLQVVETSKAKLGDDHPNTLRSIANLGRAEEAEQLDLYVVEKSKTKLGDDHPDTLSYIGNLASTYSD
ncbi:hypothetical protein N7516_010440 [Penicillium verrucosum]|uniref:uncharacterized protein n=1 Tax=Penicillium verrucosum TaxID=60171 RepID=UPI002545669B|nr:uncharacterized protein N7516_010440 [Penicillium verrucosum]KAJ5922737.1 hypothetical protein N7516_010440 [Penicillium verrucosum]